MLDSLKLEIRMVVTCYVGAGKRGSSSRTSVLNHRVIALFACSLVRDFSLKLETQFLLHVTPGFLDFPFKGRTDLRYLVLFL